MIVIALHVHGLIAERGEKGAIQIQAPSLNQAYPKQVNTRHA